MSKESIDHHYNIEYVYPDASNKPLKQENKGKGRGKKSLFIFLTLLLLLLGFLYKNGNLSKFIGTKVSTSSNETVPDSKSKQTSNQNLETNSVNSKASNIDNKKKEPNNSVIENDKVAQENSPQAIIDTIKQTSIKTDAKTTPSNQEEKINNNPATPLDTKTVVENKSIEAEKALPSSDENDALIASLDDLTEQLISERKKNEDLEAKLKENQSDKSSLSKLLAESLNQANPEDKQYLSALQDIDKDDEIQIKLPSNNAGKTTNENKEKTDEKVILVNNKAVVLDSKVADSKIAIAKETPKNASRIDYNNSVNLSMKSQIDAIILTMQKSSSSRIKKQDATVATEKTSKPNSTLQSQANDLIIQLTEQVKSDTGSNTDNDLTSVALQGKVNQLVTSKEKTQTDYQKALKEEAQERKNAIRSIVVKKGETLWSIAKRAYGDGKHYKKILKANPQITRGGTLKLSIGQVIRVPI